MHLEPFFRKFAVSISSLFVELNEGLLLDAPVCKELWLAWVRKRLTLGISYFFFSMSLPVN